MKTTLYSLVLICLMSISVYAKEQTLNYLSDPIYAPLYKGAKHPLAEVLTMAKNGDTRAQYILGDLYLKGKGGFATDIKKSQYWFEKSAEQKNLHSFVRLAAISKRKKMPVAAYKWYILGMKYSKHEDKQLYKFIKIQRQKLVKKYALNKQDISHAKKQAKTWQNPLKSKNISRQKTTPQYNL